MACALVPNQEWYLEVSGKTLFPTVALVEKALAPQGTRRAASEDPVSPSAGSVLASLWLPSIRPSSGSLEQAEACQAWRAMALSTSPRAKFLGEVRGWRLRELNSIESLPQNLFWGSRYRCSGPPPRDSEGRSGLLCNFCVSAIGKQVISFFTKGM